MDEWCYERTFGLLQNIFNTIVINEKEKNILLLNIKYYLHNKIDTTKYVY